MGGILYVCHLAVKSFLLKNLNLGFNSNFMVGVFQPSPCEAGAILCKPSGGCNTFARHYLMLLCIPVMLTPSSSDCDPSMLEIPPHPF
ncbi:hypothetical protein, partial [Pseudomonas aeruginosa]|uniref:hypothetical protein n=1 Tax=Pseudomonas aeruginosa TaxID=287 RepID=UPI001BCA03DF